MGENLEHIVKTPRLFLVTFEERYTSVNAGKPFGKYYTKSCDGLAVHVYGFQNQEEADAFNPLDLRKYLVGSRIKRILWDAENEDILMKEIHEDERIKAGTYTLSHRATYGAIENLPGCDRMYSNSKNGHILCGKPTNEFGDGCLGGCIVQGYDQDFDESYIRCPVQAYWEDRSSSKRKKVA